MLDIDGVLNSQLSKNIFTDLFPIDPYMVILVHRIVEATGAKIVLSSSWRHSSDGVKEIEKRLPNMIIGHTTLEDKKVRGDEIQEWLDEHPEVTDYAILDDTSDAGEGHGDHFFKTTFYRGLTDEIAEDVINYLNRERDD